MSDYNYNWVDNCCESGVAPCNTDVLNENLMHLKYDVFEKITEQIGGLSEILNSMYPVGAIYIGTMNTCPMQAMGFGTWELKSTGRVLQGSDGVHYAGTTIEAGLPSIAHTHTQYYADPEVYGGPSNGVGPGNGWFGLRAYNTSANTAVSSIYGNSNTVQPPAYVVNIWERIS